MNDNTSKESPVNAWLNILPSLKSGVPSISQILIEGKKAKELGGNSSSGVYESLIFLLHNSVVSLETDFSGARFAYGGIGIVIHKHAEIGHDVMIGQGVTLGGGGKPRLARSGKRSYVPKINDHVYIAAGARVLGGIEVGSLSIIGANAVVAQNIPPLSIVTGIPGEVSKTINPKN